MDVLITDLTRMYDGHVCVAGIDLSNGRRVRPVTRRGRLEAGMLSTRGGVMNIRHVVDIGRTRRCGSPPEVEDVLFDPRAAKLKRVMAPAEFFATLQKHCVKGLEAIGPGLQREGNSLVTAERAGACSLVLTAASEPARVHVTTTRSERGEMERKLRFSLADGVNVSITDARLYKADLLTPDAERVEWLQSKLAASPQVLLSFGLGRPYNKRHYLQLNNLHLGNAAEWQVT